MARKVFFSFHYARDVFRVMQVRNSWVVRGKGEAQPFFDKAEFEKVKQRAGGIRQWIEDQLAGTSVTVVLYGAQTSERPWVLHEITRSVTLRKGLLAIDIHSIKGQGTQGADFQGVNPLTKFSVSEGGRNIPLTAKYKTYDWVAHDGYSNMERWIESAARDAGY